MQDTISISKIINKVKAASLLECSDKLDLVSKIFEKEGITLSEVELDNYVSIVFTTNDEVVKLHGFSLSNKSTYQSTFIPIYSYTGQDEDFRDACRELAHNFKLLYHLSTLLRKNDYNVVKKLLPELKPFLKLFEEERNNDKEQVYNYWRKTYALCIELFGEQARG